MIETTKPVNPTQLAVELGGNVGLCCIGPDEHGVTKIECLDGSIDDKTLAKAVGAHKCDPSFCLPDPPLPPSEGDLQMALLIEAGLIDRDRAERVLGCDFTAALEVVKATK